MATDDTPSPQPYRVLARKYRPRTFAELIGQDAMVRTLTNAIHADRLPHAFILTGVRGVGKTSTARIIARALNCIGEDGNGGPTPESCGVCAHCKAITGDRHVDVIEMDAASRTGVNDIRELIDGVRYRPVDARFKIYIIDEVHMLSSSAFNALLKTLEEPPEHVKFIFATTETRKVPVTVLSRCQRFDLRRVDAETLITHFNSVAEQESATVAEGAMGLIARAADGSVRDGLSLLDQAIAHAGNAEGDEVSEEAVREMLGLADSGLIYDLFATAMQGTVDEALNIFNQLYDAGADPAIVLQDLLQLTHWLTRIKLSPAAADGQGISQMDRERGLSLAETLSVPTLGRTWQLLLKGLSEVQSLPSSAQAAEMVLIRLAYMADLPSPADLVRSLKDNPASATPAPQATATPSPALAPPQASQDDGGARMAGGMGAHDAMPQQAPIADPDPAPPIQEMQPTPLADEQSTGLQSFEQIVAMFEERREGILHATLVHHVHLVRFESGHIALRTEPEAPSDLATRVSKFLSEWTGDQWLVSLSEEAGDPTIREQLDDKEAARRGRATAHPLVQAALEAFPGATVEAVTERVPEEFPDSVDEDDTDDDIETEKADP
ncbi:MAG: DNA polymerase III subunit gamma/tau [Alphaproteobacteria bacterium]